MAERQPISGKIVEVIQNRYTAVRIASGTATEYSSSEFFLKHLKERGLMGGLAIAVRKYHEAILENDSWDKACYGWLDTGISLLIGGAHFIVIATGITCLGLEKEGSWKDWPGLGKLVRDESKKERLL